MFQETMQCLFDNADKLTCLAPYAYEPNWIYFFLIVMMLLSSYMGANPDKYPPPFPGAPFVHPTTAAIVAFFAVFCSDFLIYGIGRFFGSRVFEWGPVKRVISSEGRHKIEMWTQKYGSLACGIFRFTPGIRFPGHLACGMVKFPVWKFALVDGIAALISVPTQILILAHYGEDILGMLRKFKFVVLGLCVIGIVVYIYTKWRASKKAAV
jgi:membrane protein DedA with SNARE-associated domain